MRPGLDTGEGHAGVVGQRTDHPAIHGEMGGMTLMQYLLIRLRRPHAFEGGVKDSTGFDAIH